jgi:homoserine kinase
MHEVSEVEAATKLARAILGQTEAINELINAQAMMNRTLVSMNETLREMSQRDAWVENYRHEVNTSPAFDALRESNNP